jgi:hypothetical protein
MPMQHPEKQGNTITWSISPTGVCNPPLNTTAHHATQIPNMIRNWHAKADRGQPLPPLISRNKLDALPPLPLNTNPPPPRTRAQNPRPNPRTTAQPTSTP